MIAWDIFISHASEDKETFVAALAEGLRSRGLDVWYDDFTLRVGDSLRESIDRGLSGCDYGVVVLSRSFFAKHWPQRELNGLAAREAVDRKIILPVWLDVEKDDVARHSPMLADLVAARASDGLDKVMGELMQVIRPEAVDPGKGAALVEQEVLSSAEYRRRLVAGPAHDPVSGRYRVTRLGVARELLHVTIAGTDMQVRSPEGWTGSGPLRLGRYLGRFTYQRGPLAGQSGDHEMTWNGVEFVGECCFDQGGYVSNLHWKPTTSETASPSLEAREDPSDPA